ncbi:hypothetical protein [Sinomicrobium sp. M5D2P17]
MTFERDHLQWQQLTLRFSTLQAVFGAGGRGAIAPRIIAYNGYDTLSFPTGDASLLFFVQWNAQIQDVFFHGKKVLVD